MNRKLLLTGILLTAFVFFANARKDMRFLQPETPEFNQFARPSGAFDKPLDSIRLSDPAILADAKTQIYYMTGTSPSR